MRLRTSSLLPLLLAISLPSAAQQSASSAPLDNRGALHESLDWQTIAPHLPDPQTATAKQLELAADVLMARRFPQDALDYYIYAQQRGGDVARLLKKQGVARLELQQGPLARALFQRCVQMSKKDADAWNNLAATDYSMGNPRAAVSEYQRAVRLNKRSAIFHANLGMAYLDLKDLESARIQFSIAIKLDPQIMARRENGGMTLHVLQSQDYAMFCFEMARMYARTHDLENMKLWLQRASERGLNLREAMGEDATLHDYLKDPGIKVMIATTESFRKRAPSAAVPSLGTAEPASVPN